MLLQSLNQTGIRSPTLAKLRENRFHRRMSQHALAAVLYESRKPMRIEQVEVLPPGPGEVTVIPVD